MIGRFCFMEVWKDIEGFEGIYQVSSYGNVKGLNRVIRRHDGVIQTYKEKILKPTVGAGGYFQKTLHNLKHRKTMSLHRLVALAFIPNPDGKETVNHIDGCKTNNDIENLEWATKSENTQHAFDIGLKQGSKGVANGRCKLTEKQVLEIREKYIPYKCSFYKLADEYNVNRVSIEYIVKRKTWKHI